MTDRHIPGIYGELSDEARYAYGQWILALFSLTEHVGWCPFGCQGARYVCDEGRGLYAGEQQRCGEWHAVRPAGVTRDA